MLSFVFEFTDTSKEFYRYDDYGDITLHGRFGSWSSKVGSRHIFLVFSLSALLYEIEQFVILKKESHEYIGVDTSFGFWMIRSASHISIYSNIGERIHIEDLNDEELILCTWKSLNEFLFSNEKRFDRLGEDGEDFSDFDRAYKRFKINFRL